MIIKFIKPHPILHKHGKPFSGRPNFYNAPIKAMNLIMQGYATLEHSCKNCNPFHIDTNKDDYNKPFKYDDEWYEKKHDNCYED